MSENILEDMSEKYVKKNVRTDCPKRSQKIYQKRISENMFEKDIRRIVTKNVFTKRFLLNSRRQGA